MLDYILSLKYLLNGLFKPIFVPGIFLSAIAHTRCHLLDHVLRFSELVYGAFKHSTDLNKFASEFSYLIPVLA